MNAADLNALHALGEGAVSLDQLLVHAELQWEAAEQYVRWPAPRDSGRHLACPFCCSDAGRVVWVE